MGLANDSVKPDLGTGLVQLQECGYTEHSGPSGNWVTLRRFKTYKEAAEQLANTPTNWTSLRLFVDPREVT